MCSTTSLVVGKSGAAEDGEEGWGEEERIVEEEDSTSEEEAPNEEEGEPGREVEGTSFLMAGALASSATQVWAGWPCGTPSEVLHSSGVDAGAGVGVAWCLGFVAPPERLPVLCAGGPRLGAAVDVGFGAGVAVGLPWRCLVLP